MVGGTRYPIFAGKQGFLEAMFPKGGAFRRNELERSRAVRNAVMEASPESSKLVQEVRNFRLCPVHRADKLSAHHAIPVDDVGFWELEGSVESVALSARIPHGRETHVVILYELSISAFVYVDANCQHDHALGFHAPLHLDQRR